MKCVVCGGGHFSIRLSDINKPENERYSKYGDCCSFICALKKVTLEVKENPDHFEEVTLTGTNSAKYSIKVPIRDKKNTVSEENTVNEDTVKEENATKN